MRSKRDPLNTQKVFQETRLHESTTSETFAQIASMHERCFDVRGVVIEGLSKIALRDVTVPLVGEQLEILRDNSRLVIGVDALGIYPNRNAGVAMVNINLSSKSRAALMGLQAMEQDDTTSLYISSQTSFVVPGFATAIRQRLSGEQGSAVRKVDKIESKKLKEQWVTAANGSL